MNIDAKPEEVVTSALATANYIADEKSDATVYTCLAVAHSFN